MCRPFLSFSSPDTLRLLQTMCWYHQVINIFCLHTTDCRTYRSICTSSRFWNQTHKNLYVVGFGRTWGSGAERNLCCFPQSPPSFHFFPPTHAAERNERLFSLICHHCRKATLVLLWRAAVGDEIAMWIVDGTEKMVKRKRKKIFISILTLHR